MPAGRWRRPKGLARLEVGQGSPGGAVKSWPGLLPLPAPPCGGAASSLAAGRCAAERRGRCLLRDGGALRAGRWGRPRAGAASGAADGSLAAAGGCLTRRARHGGPGPLCEAAAAMVLRAPRSRVSAAGRGLPWPRPDPRRPFSRSRWAPSRPCRPDHPPPPRADPRRLRRRSFRPPAGPAPAATPSRAPPESRLEEFPA